MALVDSAPAVHYSGIDGVGDVILVTPAVPVSLCISGRRLAEDVREIRPFSKMAAENSNKLKLKTDPRNRKSAFTLISNPAKFQRIRCNIS